jgi:hypothetical protein
VDACVQGAHDTAQHSTAQPAVGHLDTVQRSTSTAQRSPQWVTLTLIALALVQPRYSTLFLPMAAGLLWGLAARCAASPALVLAAAIEGGCSARETMGTAAASGGGTELVWAG